MALVLGSPQGGNKKYDVPEIKNGQYPARLVQIVTIGLQEQIDWQTKEPKDPKQRILLTFELPTQRIETDDGDMPRWLSKEYTASTFETAALPGVVENINPLFDLETEDMSGLLGSECMVMIGHTVSDNPKITGVNPLFEGVDVGEAENPLTLFNFHEPVLEDFKALPKWVQKKVMAALDFKGSGLEALMEVEGYQV